MIAYGHIGREIARLAAAFGARVVALTRAGKPSVQGGFHMGGTGDVDGVVPDKYYRMGEREEVLAFLGECDVVVDSEWRFISLGCRVFVADDPSRCAVLPNSKETYRFIGCEELKAMKVRPLLAWADCAS